MGREFELKYQATEAQLRALWKKYHVGNAHCISMETTYYDTPDKALAAKKWTLRLRKENGLAVCTLKVPLRDGSRGEWEVTAEPIEAGILELCKLGAPKELILLTADGVVPVCGARFTRMACPLISPDCSLELALDEGVLLGGGREEPLREVEVELKAGSEIAVVAFAEALAKEYGLTPERYSKFRRALALAENKSQEKNNGI